MRALWLVLVVGALAVAWRPPAALAGWSPGVKATLPAGAGGDTRVDAVSCASPGNCAAAGFYTDGPGAGQQMLFAEISGSWRAGVETPESASTNVDKGSVSCAPAGSCTAVANGGRSLVTETAGVWDRGVSPAPPSDANPSDAVLFTSVSCPSPGNCTAVGIYWDSSNEQQAMMVNQGSGTWGTAVKATPPSDIPSEGFVSLTHVSCSSPGYCAAVGSYGQAGNPHSNGNGLLLTESGGAWSPGVRPPGPPAGTSVSVESVSCPSAGNCAAVGNWYDGGREYGLLLTDISGNWTGIKAPNPSVENSPDPFYSVDSVSCPSPGTCTAVGGDLSWTETAGTWSGPTSLPAPDSAGDDEAGSVSCTSPGNCAAVGDYIDGANNQRGLLLTESSGKWSAIATAALPADAAASPDVSLGPVFCLPSGDCSAVGTYTDTSGHMQGLLLSGTVPGSGAGSGTVGGGTGSGTLGTGKPSLLLSAPSRGKVGQRIAASALSGTLVPGLKPVGTITFKVFGPQPSPPSNCSGGGTVVGTASAYDYGVYQSSRGFTPARAGTYWWYARYGGDSHNRPAASRCGAGMRKMVVSARHHDVSPPVQLLGSPRFAGNRLSFNLACSGLSGSKCHTVSVVSSSNVVVGRVGTTIADMSIARVTLTLNAHGRSLLSRLHAISATLRIKLGGHVVLKRKLTLSS